MTRKIEEIVTGIWRKKKREEEEREEEEKKKRRRKKRGRNVIEELTEEEKEHGDDKLKSSKANEWGKLDWNWTNRNEEKCEKRQRRKLKKWTRDRWIRNGSKKRRGMKSSNKRNGGKCQGILRKSSQWCNWDMKGKRRVRKKNLKEEEKEKGGVETQSKEEQLTVNINEAKIMNEENWIETTKMRKNLKKPMNKFVK